MIVLRYIFVSLLSSGRLYLAYGGKPLVLSISVRSSMIQTGVFNTQTCYLAKREL